MKHTLVASIVLVAASIAIGQTVTNTADSGAGSLRQAVADASPGTTITFDAGLSGQTITLTTGPLSITKDLEIDAGALPGGVIISGDADASGSPTGADSRVLEIGAGGHTVVLRRLRIRQGVAGGFPDDVGAGVFNDGGDLTLVACTLDDNHATSGSFAGGGAIFNSVGSILTLEDSTLHDNHATSGGGIYNFQGTVTLVNSTIANNEATPDGGGIYNLLGSVAASHTTISGNTAGFGGGIYNGDSLTLEHSIVAGNTASTNPDIQGSFAGTGNLVGGSPILAPLGNYGGPTPTRPPLAGSPALGAAVGTASTSDQRGAQRPIDSGPDLGAVEMPDGGYEPPRITSIAPGSLPGELTLRWLHTRVDYVVESSGNLVFGEPGDALIPVDDANGTVDSTSIPGEIEFQFSDSAATGNHHFWRVGAN